MPPFVAVPTRAQLLAVETLVAYRSLQPVLARSAAGP